MTEKEHFEITPPDDDFPDVDIPLPDQYQNPPLPTHPQDDEEE
jgi:hypothetical protein